MLGPDFLPKGTASPRNAFDARPRCTAVGLRPAPPKSAARPVSARAHRPLRAVEADGLEPDCLPRGTASPRHAYAFEAATRAGEELIERRKLMAEFAAAIEMIRRLEARGVALSPRERPPARPQSARRPSPTEPDALLSAGHRIPTPPYPSTITQCSYRPHTAARAKAAFRVVSASSPMAPPRAVPTTLDRHADCAPALQEATHRRRPNDISDYRELILRYQPTKVRRNVSAPRGYRNRVSAPRGLMIYDDDVLYLYRVRSGAQRRRRRVPIGLCDRARRGLGRFHFGLRRAMPGVDSTVDSSVNSSACQPRRSRTVDRAAQSADATTRSREIR